MVVIGGTALTGGRGTILGHRARHPHPARDAQRHRAGRRARPRLQHLHRRDHSWHDGAPLLARAPTSGGDLTDERRSHPHGAHRQVLRSRAGARRRQLQRRTPGDRRPPGRQWRGQVDADQGAFRRRARDQRRHHRARQARRHPQHDRRDRARHRDDLPGFGARHAALDRAQSVPRPRAAQGSALPEPHGRKR